MTIVIRLCHGIGCDAIAESGGRTIHSERGNSVESAVGLLLLRLMSNGRPERRAVTVTDIADCNGCDGCVDTCSRDEF
jgi:ferredoxin